MDRFGLFDAISLIATMGGSPQPTSSTNEAADKIWKEKVVQQYRKILEHLNSQAKNMSIDELTQLIDIHDKYEDYIVKVRCHSIQSYKYSARPL